MFSEKHGSFKCVNAMQQNFSDQTERTKVIRVQYMSSFEKRTNNRRGIKMNGGGMGLTQRMSDCEFYSPIKSL